MRIELDQVISDVPRAALALVLALVLVACEKEPAVEMKTAAPAAVAAKKIETQASAEKGKPIDAKPTAADAALAAKIKAALAADPALKGTGIDVVAADGKVSLFGTVESARQMTAAAKIASLVPGVTSVTNKMVVLAGS